MLAPKIREVSPLWPAMARVLYVPRTEAEYRDAVALLDSLIDEVGEDESHPLASMMEVLGVLIERYEDEHVPELN
jgi:HTH-type transcriptional regulator / antitoxin HigA